MKQILTMILTLSLASQLQAASIYNISSNSSWSSTIPSYCGNCTINIASGATLNLNNSSMCDNCKISGGAIKITGGFSFQSSTISNTSITATSSFTLNNTNSFSDVTAVISGSSSFTANGALTLTNSSFTFENTASFTSNGQLNIDNSQLDLNDNSHFTSNSSTVNLKNGSTLVAGDGSKSSKAYMIFYGQLNLVDAASMLIISNSNNYYYSWNTYKSQSNGTSYTTTSNYQAYYYGGAVFSSQGPLPISILPITIDGFKAAEINPHSVKLTWTLTDASGGESVQVERSNNGGSFSTLTTLTASRQDADYAYTDEAAVLGENDYRIKMTSADGKVSYSKIIAAHVAGTTTSLRVFPNPCTGGNFQIQFPSVQSAMINVFTIDGRLLYMSSVSGQSQYAVNTPGAGNSKMLVVQIVTKEKSWSFNLLNSL